MPGPDRIDDRRMAARVARELVSGDVVAIGSGLPALVPGLFPAGSGVTFVSGSGAVGYQALGGTNAPGDSAGVSSLVDSSGQDIMLAPGGSVLSTVDLAGMTRAGYVDTAVIQPAQLGADGAFCHWTSASTPGIPAPSDSVDLASGARRVVAIMTHTTPDGQPAIVAECTLPPDGVIRRGTIITDLAVLSVDPDGLVITEVAPGWSVDDIVALTGAPVRVAAALNEMVFDVPSFDPINKVYSTGLEAVADMPNGSTVMIDGFAGPGGMPHYLMVALRDHGAKQLTMVSNTAGIARVIGFGTPPGLQAIDHSILIENHQIKKAIASYPVSPSPTRPSAFELAWQQGEVEIEVVPQGTLAERIRAAGAGVAAFYTPTGVGTLLTEGKETRVIGGKEYVLEPALRADYCLIRGYKADTLGNVIYKGTSRNFNAVMAPAARTTIIEVDEIVGPGELDPEAVVTPGVFIDRVVQRPADFSPYE